MKKFTPRLTNAAWLAFFLPTFSIIQSKPVVSISRSSLVFASQITATSSNARVITLKNTGVGTLSVSTITVVGAHASDFSSLGLRRNVVYDERGVERDAEDLGHLPDGQAHGPEHGIHLRCC